MSDTSCSGSGKEKGDRSAVSVAFVDFLRAGSCAHDLRSLHGRTVKDPKREVDQNYNQQ